MCIRDRYYPLIEELIAQLKTYATDWADIPMLAKTHGQPASPTRLVQVNISLCSWTVSVFALVEGLPLREAPL